MRSADEVEEGWEDFTISMLESRILEYEIEIGTPEASSGSTADAVIFLGTQKRRLTDESIGGHMLCFGGRYVSFTRCAKCLYLFFEKLNFSSWFSWGRGDLWHAVANELWTK